ncbi:ATP-binding cassette domain-containing protein [Anaerotalea alkaliphila]|uniref:Sugar ABC transporter ATP-binding protein n=1 Tax=Anaerotalea alkaliphila TaxID=2662126 RepID=A0A7X5HXY6_9FIRM|nr:ATP-binding cassette domain-containing protein [Anaerotalea alkaliphila]NDL68692.1 sugar ABC transporter ATP-binding protein [Anaerotalea alkaliphila]
MEKEILRAVDLHTEQEREPLLKGFRLQVFSGELVGLVGLNGSGKSTFAKVLGGEVPLSRGTLALEAGSVHVIQKETRLVSNLRVAENLVLAHGWKPARILSDPGKKARLVEALLREYSPRVHKDDLGGSLSPAAQCQVGILKAFLGGARLIVLDRILEYCSPKEERELLNLVGRLKAKGPSFLVTYNKVAPCLEGFDRLAVVREGKVVRTLHRDEYSPDLAAQLMAGGDFRRNKVHQAPAVRDRTGAAALSVEGPVPFVLGQGEILGVHDGSRGRAMALFRQLLGEEGKEHLAVHRGIGVLSEALFEHQILPGWKPGENLLLAVAKRVSGPLGILPGRVVRHMARTLPGEMGIPEGKLDLPARNLERDQQFLLALRKAVLGGAKVLLVENPFQGADLVTKELAYQRLGELAAGGMGILLFSGDLGDLAGFCHRILLFQEDGSWSIRDGLAMGEETVVQSIL